VSESQVKEQVKENLNGTTSSNGANGFALPGVLGALAEHGVARAQEGCVRMKLASEQMVDALSETCSANAGSATSYGLKVIEFSNANTAATIDFLVQLLGSKSATDVLTLSAEQARKAFDAASAQNRELWNLAQKIATDAAEPARKHVAKIFHQAS
jgi:phasin